MKIFFKVKDCGVPANIPPATVAYNATTCNQNAVYTCNGGTEVIAVCNLAEQWHFLTDFNTSCDPTNTTSSGTYINNRYGLLLFFPAFCMSYIEKIRVLMCVCNKLFI